LATAIASTFSAAVAETCVVVFTGRELAGPGWLPAALRSATVLVTRAVTAWVPFCGDEHHRLRVAAWLTLTPEAVVVVSRATCARWPSASSSGRPSVVRPSRR